MAFYDKEIKRVCESCPRLLILMINSVFSKHHAENAEIIFLDKEQNIESNKNTTYMDMLLEIEACRYHIEYQLLEGNMAIRMVEYGMKETIRGLRQNGDITKVSDGRYEIELVMPLQAVVFLAGANKEDKITVKLHLPNGKIVTYELPCISASETVSELSRKKMYLLIPFQQVQLYSRMLRARHYTEKTKLRLAESLYSFRLEAKKELDNLRKNGILNANEVELLVTSLHNIEDNLLNSDDLIREKVTEMGDEDYVALSDRLIQQGVEQGIKEGMKQGMKEGVEQGTKKTLLSLISKKLQKGKSLAQIADECELTQDEAQEYIDEIKGNK